MLDVKDRERLAPKPVTPSLILEGWEQFLIYGPGGTGKTFTAATAPEPQWWLTPGGLSELKAVYSKGFVKKHGMKEMYVTSVKEARESGQMKDNPTGYDDCCHAVDIFLEENEQLGLGVQSIIVDNATVIEEYMLNKAIMAEYHLAGAKDKTTLAREREFGIRRPHDTTWNGAQSFMDRWVNWLRELPFHLIFVAHDYESWEQEEDRRTRKLVSIKPLFVGAQRTSVPNKFSNVWYSMVSGGGRSQTWGVQPERDAIREAKTRVGGILDPNYAMDVNITDVIQRFKQHALSLEGAR